MREKIRALPDKLGRRRIDRIQNLLIVLLSCTALFLVGKTGLFQAVAGQETGQGGSIAVSGDQDTELSRARPTALMAQNAMGRYGVRWDDPVTGDLYASGLNDFLTRALAAMKGPDSCGAEEFQAAVTQGETWVYYDFLYNMTFDSKGEEEGRIFLVTARNGLAEAVYYYDQQAGAYFTGRIRDAEIPLPEVVGKLVGNEGRFAFEPEPLAFPAYVMVLPQQDACPVYTVGNPMEWGLTPEMILGRLDFNSKATSVYVSADSTVVREGGDTLRIQQDGTVSFHGADGEAKYQAPSQRHADLQGTAEGLLAQMMADVYTQGRVLCQDIEVQADGSVALTFCWMLDGVQVQVMEEGWLARFVFQGNDLTNFEVHLRQYLASDQITAVLPEEQAAAAAAAMGQEGKELQLCYRDEGSGDKITAAWMVREPGQGG